MTGEHIPPINFNKPDVIKIIIYFCYFLLFSQIQYFPFQGRLFPNMKNNGNRMVNAEK